MKHQLFPQEPPRRFRLSALLLFGMAAALMLALSATSCIKDGADINPTADNTMITFAIRVPGEVTPSSRALTTPDESAVEAMDILLFDAAANGGGFVYHAAAGAVTIDGNREGTFSVQLPIGTFDMVLIANARTEVEAAVAAFTAATTKDDLQDAIVISQSGKWPADSPDHRPIPMWAEIAGAIIKEGNTISGVNLIRSLGKINVEVTAANFTLKEVHLYNPMGRGYVFPLPANMTGMPPKAGAPTLDPAWARENSSLVYTDAAPGAEVKNNACKNEIYTFEAPAGDGTASAGTDITDGNTFLVIGGEYGSDGVTTYYRIDLLTTGSDGTVNYLPLKRNHRYEVIIQGVPNSGAATANAAVSETPANIVAEIVVRNEGDMHYFVYDDQYFLGADDREFRVSGAAGTSSFNVSTDYPQGWTAKASDSPTDPDAGSTWLSTTAIGAMGKNPLEFKCTQNGGENDREGYIHILAGGRLEAVVKIVQGTVFDPSLINQTPIEYGYVGAFWRADQTGERLIRITAEANGNSIYGMWTATVKEGADWIILDTEQPAGGVEWNGGTAADMLDPANDAAFQVTGTATTVTGVCTPDATGEIYFRIGVKGTIPADENRYGVILLTYNENTKNHLIFVRQGHEPDYLMRPEDNHSDGSIITEWGGTAAVPRPKARKISPYNLTTREFNAGSTVSFIQLNRQDGKATGNHGVFTDYPSQAGAFFKWIDGPGEERNAYNPMGNFISTSYTEGLWDPIKEEHETCPPGYRRFSDGRSDILDHNAEVADSEVRQSFFHSPFSGNDMTNYFLNPGENFLYGYLADGFFDRRETELTQAGRYTGVDIQSVRSGYVGSLYYNPYSSSNIFFPLQGVITENGLTMRGLMFYFWSTRSTSLRGGCYMFVSGYSWVGVASGTFHGYEAGSVRCIVE